MWVHSGQVRGVMSLSIMEPIKRPNLFKRLGLSSPAGVLLYGPPGCGKVRVLLLLLLLLLAERC